MFWHDTKSMDACCTGPLFLYVNVVRPDCNYLSLEALGKVQQALVQVCIQP